MVLDVDGGHRVGDEIIWRCRLLKQAVVRLTKLPTVLVDLVRRLRRTVLCTQDAGAVVAQTVLPLPAAPEKYSTGRTDVPARARPVMFATPLWTKVEKASKALRSTFPFPVIVRQCCGSRVLGTHLYGKSGFP